jgi:hypothetical protein
MLGADDMPQLSVMADTTSNTVRYTGRYLRFDLVTRLGEAATGEGAKQADKSNASSNVHSTLILYGARNFLAWVNEALLAG